MEGLNTLLKRLHDSLHKDEIIKKKVVATISGEAGIVLEESKISLKEGVLSIEASPVVNMEIRLREEKIKKLLQTEKVLIQRILYK